MTDATLARLTFGPWKTDADDAWLEAVDEAFHGYMSSLVRCGQIIGEPVPGVLEGNLSAFVRLPALDSLNVEHSSRYGQKHLEHLASLFGQKPVVTLLSSGDSRKTCAQWDASPWLVLMEPPLDGLGAARTHDLDFIPNYRLPLDADDAEKLYFWSRENERHSGTWFASGSLEVETHQALADPLSDLNLKAGGLAWMVEKAVGKPVYSVLFRHYALPGSAEAERPCPLCGKPWKVEDERFHFRCEPCRLVGDIGPSDPERGWEEIGTWEGRLRQPQDDCWKAANARTLLGMLQRGQGQGFRRLLDEAPPRAWALIEDCLRHDPRLDWQVESRDWYYGTLILKTQMPLARVWRVLDIVDEEDTLVLSVIAFLAGAGIAEALDVLEAQISKRQDWQSAAFDLATSASPKAAVRLCRALAHRFAEPQALAEAVLESWNIDNSLFKPLRQHGASAVKEAVEQHKLRRIEQAEERETAKQPFLHLSLQEAISAAESSDQPYLLGHCAAMKATAADIPWLLSQLSHEARQRSVVALMALVPVADISMLEPLVAFSEGLGGKMNRSVSVRLRAVLLCLPASALLPLARDWIQSAEADRHALARSILAKHATLEDVPLLRQLLSKGLHNEETHLYLMCDCLEAFARFGGYGRVPEVAQAYEQMRYSHGRKLAARALAALDSQEFRERYAQDCRFDCDEETRALGEG